MKKPSVLLVVCILVFAASLFLIPRLEIFKSKTGNSFNAAQVLAHYKEKNSDVFGAIRDDLGPVINKYGIDGAIKLSEAAFVDGSISLTHCHNLLHLIGHEAYQRSSGNFSEIARRDSNICIASFQHGVEGQIATTNDDTKVIVDELKTYCTSLRGVIPGISCYHGAGHGYFRKTLDVSKSLSVCDALLGGPENDLSDCYRGVFSEYGNLAVGIDGDTGLTIPGKRLVEVDEGNPFEICQKFDKKYEESCVSQLTKVIFQGSDIPGSLGKCMEARYPIDIQVVCFKIISAIHAEEELSKNETVKTPEIVLTISPTLKQAYLNGVKLAFLSFKNTGVEKEWKPVCESFREPLDKSFCLKLFSS